MKKHIIAFSTGLLFGHHVVCTVLYNAPINPLTGVYQIYVANYMDPYFTQKWLLFAPEPAISDLKLWYRLKHNNKWESWLDPLEPILKKHQQRRFTYNAKLIYIYGNIARDLNSRNVLTISSLPCKDNDSKCLQVKTDSVMRSPEFSLAIRYVKEDVAKSFPNKKNDSIQIMLIQLYPKQFSERLSKKPFGYANSTEFQPVAFEDND